jgi:HsdM-like protein
MPGALDDLETRLWDAADNLRANSGLGPSEYSTPVLGLIFLRFADVKFTHADHLLRDQLPPNSRRTIGPADYQALGDARGSPPFRVEANDRRPPLLRIGDIGIAGVAAQDAARKWLVVQHTRDGAVVDLAVEGDLADGGKLMSGQWRVLGLETQGVLTDSSGQTASVVGMWRCAGGESW